MALFKFIAAVLNSTSATSLGDDFEATTPVFIFDVVLAGKDTRTLPVAVYNVLTFEQISWGPLAAAALLVTLPVLLVTLLAERQIVAGLSTGGLKDG